MILPGARYLPSPNCSSREGAAVDAVVLHHISLPPGRFGGDWVADLFLNRLDPGAHPYFAGIADLRVSAHFLIHRGGEVTQFVDTELKAWHAGESSLVGVPDVNRCSVGIELEGDEETPYEEAQYRALEELLCWVREVHPAVVAERVVGHEHVAPGRKRDPGPLFDWDRVRACLNRLPTTARQGPPRGERRGS